MGDFSLAKNLCVLIGIQYFLCIYDFYVVYFLNSGKYRVLNTINFFYVFLL